MSQSMNSHHHHQEHTTKFEKHKEHGQSGHHDHHEHMVEDFKKRFWISLAINARFLKVNSGA